MFMKVKSYKRFAEEPYDEEIIVNLDQIVEITKAESSGFFVLTLAGEMFETIDTTDAQKVFAAIGVSLLSLDAE